MIRRTKKLASNMRNTAFYFAVFPTNEQKILIAKTFGCCRFIYNTKKYRQDKHFKDFEEMINISPAQLKKEFSFLEEVDSLALCNAQLNCETAYKNYYNGKGNNRDINASYNILDKGLEKLSGMGQPDEPVDTGCVSVLEQEAPTSKLQVA